MKNLTEGLPLNGYELMERLGVLASVYQRKREDLFRIYSYHITDFKEKNGNYVMLDRMEKGNGFHKYKEELQIFCFERLLNFLEGGKNET